MKHTFLTIYCLLSFTQIAFCQYQLTKEDEKQIKEWERKKPYKDADDVDSYIDTMRDCEIGKKKAILDLKNKQYRYLIKMGIGSYTPRLMIWCDLLRKRYNIIPISVYTSCLDAIDDDAYDCYNRVIENYFYWQYNERIDAARKRLEDSVVKHTHIDTIRRWFPFGGNTVY